MGVLLEALDEPIPWVRADQEKPGFESYFRNGVREFPRKAPGSGFSNSSDPRPGSRSRSCSSASTLRPSSEHPRKTMDEDYVRTARAKGLSERRRCLSHVLRNPMISSTLWGLDFAVVVGCGAIPTETVSTSRASASMQPTRSGCRPAADHGGVTKARRLLLRWSSSTP